MSNHELCQFQRLVEGGYAKHSGSFYDQRNKNSVYAAKVIAFYDLRHTGIIRGRTFCQTKATCVNDSSIQISSHYLAYGTCYRIVISGIHWRSAYGRTLSR